MADKRHIKKSITTLQRVTTWQLVVLLLLACLLSATLLRLNNVGMVERRTAVARADKRGAADEVMNALSSLQRHASSHMNASTGLIYLQESYNRDTKAAIATAQKANASVGNNVLNRADATCKRQYAGFSQAYVQCVANEQAKIPASSQLKKAELPNPELYRQEYLSPAWTPDFAGWSVVICVVLTLVIIGRLLTLLTLRLLLRRHYSSI